MKTYNWRAIRAIIRKDMKLCFQNKMVWLPMIIVPLMFVVIFPLVIVVLPSLAPASEFDPKDFASLMHAMPASITKGFEGMTMQQQFTVIGANYLFAPMFLIIPLMIASILAADSFAGERERKTMEGLLYTPVSDRDLFVAKLLGAFVPAMVALLGSFILYGLVVNIGGYHSVGHIFFPSVTWWPLLLWLGPAISAAGLGATVLASSKAKSFMEAQQVSGFLVLPIVVLMIGQITGLFFLSVWIEMLIGLVIWLVGGWLVYTGARTFTRGEVLAKI